VEPRAPTAYPTAASRDAVIFHPTPIKGAYTVELEKRGDERGFFARSFCAKEFASRGMDISVVQANNSFTAKKGTLRGMHYQLPPADEVKIVRCLRGAFYDAILDIRPDSPSFGLWFGAELTPDNRLMMVVPRGCAHGLLSLQDDSEALYLVSASYAPEQERGVRYNDPKFAINWPLKPDEVSAKDAAWPDFDAHFHGIEKLRGLIS